jgi:hypothetical protein
MMKNVSKTKKQKNQLKINQKNQPGKNRTKSGILK